VFVIWVKYELGIFSGIDKEDNYCMNKGLILVFRLEWNLVCDFDNSLSVGSLSPLGLCGDFYLLGWIWQGLEVIWRGLDRLECFALDSLAEPQMLIPFNQAWQIIYLYILSLLVVDSFESIVYSLVYQINFSQV